MLQTLLPDRDRTLDLNSSSQQTRLTVHLVTRKRAVATPNAEIHVHHEHVGAVDDAGCDLFFLGFALKLLAKLPS